MYIDLSEEIAAVEDLKSKGEITEEEAAIRLKNIQRYRIAVILHQKGGHRSKINRGRKLTKTEIRDRHFNQKSQEIRNKIVSEYQEHYEKIVKESETAEKEENTAENTENPQ